MKKGILIGAITLVVLVAGFAGYVAAKPSAYEVKRSREIAATPDRIQPYLADLEKWSEWSPWDELDPNMKKEYSKPAAGAGASYSWVGNDKVGKGKMTITAVEPTRVAYHLEFIEPFKSEADHAMTLVAVGDKTRVEWVMTGKFDFMGKLMCTFMDFDALIGADFEKGLGKLEAKVTGG